MRQLPWGVLGVLAALTTVNFVFMGCGSEDSNGDITGQDDGGDGSSGSTSSGASGSSSGSTSSSSGSTSSSSGSTSSSSGSSGSSGDAGACLNNGSSCTKAGDCCTNTCIPTTDGGTTMVCAPSPVPCKAGGTACTTAGECCGLSCKGNVCQTCVPDTPVAGNCTGNADCCSQNCQNGKCAPIQGSTGGDGGTPVCRSEGNPCTAPSECCSGYCTGGTCRNVSFCAQVNDICFNNYECCGGLCNKAAGATAGVCADLASGGGCEPAGSVCTGMNGDFGCDNKCCSKSCGPFGTTGVHVCQPPSGCKPDYEVCSSTSDCCGSPPNPTGGLDPAKQPTCEKPSAGDPYGRCTKALQCSPPGAICKIGTEACGVNNRCCDPVGQPSNYCQSNPDNCCGKDALGIPRCLVAVVDCSGAKPPAGTTCATSADCCGNPCVNNQCLGGTTTCVAAGGKCTTNSDCCSGLPCTLSAGSTSGICGGVLQTDGGVAPPPPDAGTTDASTADGSTDAAVDATPPPPPCALYGQTCAAAGDCCSGVPCTSGRCVYP